MTEINNLFQNGYAGGVKSDVSNIQLQQCSENDISDFKLQIKSSLNSDNATIDYQTRASLGPGNYNIDNMYGCDCSLEKAREVQLSQPSVNFNGGKGWMGENGCLIDTDSNLRQNTEILTNRRVINQLTTRLSSTTPNYSKGYYDVDTESIIRPGDFASDQKPCIGTTEATFGNYFTPMIPKLKTEVQDNKHIIPEDSIQDWVRGGLPTRQMIRNEDYLRRCQEKTLE